MRKTKLLFIFQIVLLCLLAPAVVDAQMTSASYRIPAMVFSGGGGSMASAGYQMTSTAGQSSPLGYSASTNYQADAGFWYTIALGLLIGDVNGDGSVNLVDVINVLQITTGQSPAEIHQEADVDGDGRIGISEAIMILHKLGNL